MNADGYFGLRFRKLADKILETCCGEIVITQHNISLQLIKEIVKLLGKIITEILNNYQNI